MLQLLLTVTISVSAQIAHGLNTALQIHNSTPQLELRDQHDAVWDIPANTKLILFSASRDANTLAQEVLSTKPVDYLETRKVVYFSDMSKMPSFITRMFALPSMRDLPYRVGVVLDAKDAEIWPRRDGAITAVYLENQKITRIEFIEQSATLSEVLERM